VPADWLKGVGLTKIRKGTELLLVCFEQDFRFLNLNLPTGFQRKYRGQALILGDWGEKVSEAECRKVNRKILASYLVGYETIRVKNRTGSLPEKLTEQIGDFVGKKMRALLEETSGELKIEPTRRERFALRKNMNEMISHIKLMHKTAQVLMEDFKPTVAQAILKIDDKVDALCHEVVRFCKLAAQNPLVILELGMRNYRDLMGYRVIIRRIERCADHARRCVADMLELFEREGRLEFKPEIKNEMKKIIKEVDELLDKAVFALFESSKKYYDADEVIDRADSLVQVIDHASRNISAENKSMEQFWCERRIFGSFKRFVEYTKTVAEIVCNMYVISSISK